MITIDINDWVETGGGNMGTSYFHKSNPEMMLKFDGRNIPPAVLEREIENAKIISRLGLPTPEPGDVVTDGTRYGLMFKRVGGKVSFAKLCGDDPDMIPALAKEFAGIVKKVHSTEGKGSGLADIKETYGNLISRSTAASDEFKAKALRCLEQLPDAGTCLHGDLHFGNMIKSGDQSYIIDVGDFSYGHPYFDFAMIFTVDRLASAETEKHVRLFHNQPEDSHNFLRCVVKEYFGSETTPESLEKELIPFMAIRHAVMGSLIGHNLNRNVIKDTFEYIENNY